MAYRMAGFWGTIFKGSLAAGKVALATAAGGPAGGTAAAAGEIGGAVKGGGGGGGGTKQQPAAPVNVLAGMNNTQLALLTMGGMAVLIGLGGRRR